AVRKAKGIADGGEATLEILLGLACLGGMLGFIIVPSIFYLMWSIIYVMWRLECSAAKAEGKRVAAAMRRAAVNEHSHEIVTAEEHLQSCLPALQKTVARATAQEGKAKAA